MPHRAVLGGGGGGRECGLSCRADRWRAGQGAHREVGSEGFEAKHRAVAEIGEPVGPIQVMPSPHCGGEGNTWGTWAQQGVCGRRGGTALCVTPGDLVWSRSTELGSWAYKPRGEIASDAVREVGVTRGTYEPGNNRKPGTVVMVRRRAVTQKAPAWGRGHGGNGGIRGDAG